MTQPGECAADPLRRKLEDPSWLEQTALRHDEVVHVLSRHGSTASFAMVEQR